MTDHIRVSSQFDGGNIICRSAERADDIQLDIRHDNESHFYQWFYFRLTGAQDQDCRMRLMNASGSAYTPGWEEYQAVASYDRENWFRVPTKYENGELVIEHTPYLNAVYYAYFAPYTMERHQDLIASAADSDLTHVSVLGTTLDGQDIDLLTVGTPGEGKLSFWLTARQHPGETMAEWWMEGFIGRLLDETDPVSRRLLERAVFYLVPNMNPDGSRRGHLRTNAAGINLNREWDKASLEKSPEVFCVLQKMIETGVDFALDVHGDENLPYNFIAGGEGAPGFTDHQQNLLDSYKAALAQISPDFQTEFGYPVDAPGTADLSICTNYMAWKFGCLAMTLEMPFKDSKITPDPDFGWSPGRCIRLGVASLDAMWQVIDLIEEKRG
ncbi:MAG: M14-type cytosolic carboxypeptidase [Aquisalinus sp.]|nr:M14-type cytosolic carboxypeptidase [Aquisalinus sp.]